MINVRTVMTKEALFRLARRDAEIDRLFALPDRWLARELVSHARAARSIGREIFGFEAKRPDRYQSELVWDVIPEIAFRLGETSFMNGERGGGVRSMSDMELRLLACEQLHSRPLLLAFARNLHHGVNVYSLLTNWPTGGNPVVFALDRIVPADREDPDWAARAINKACEAMGYDDVYEWTAELREAAEEWRFLPDRVPAPDNMVAFAR